MIPPLFVVAADAVAWRISLPFWALYIFKEMKSTPEQLGMALAISAGIPALTGSTLGSKLDKLGGRPFLAASECAAVGCYLSLLLVTRAEFSHLSAIFAGFAYSLWVPALNAHIVHYYGREKYGQTFGTLALAAGIASSASPTLGGWMWDNISPRSPFIVTPALAVVIGFVIWFKIKEPE